MRKIEYVCDICKKSDGPIYNLILQEQTADGSDGDLDGVVDGVSAIDICGTCALKAAPRIKYALESLTRKSVESQKPVQDEDKKSATLVQDPDKKPAPIPKKVVAGSAERKRPGKPKKVIDTGKVHALHDAGWSYEKIALEELDCSPATLMKRLKEEGGA